MSSFNDKNIEQGVRKRTEYENTRRARLVLNVDRKDGGKLQLPILLDARTTDEEENIQQNTLLAVVPMARLPGYDSHGEAPRGALPRPGRIYVFLQNRLWRELECDGRGQLFEVDVAHWRKKAEQGGNADQRDPVGKTQHLIILPVILQGRDVANDLYMAYSEMPWTWEYIQWLEASSGRIKNRCQNIRPAWAAAVVDAKQWKPTQTMPALPIANIIQGLCARELHLETLLEDPSLYTPQLKALPTGSLLGQLESRQRELAGHMNQTPPDPLPPLVTKDLLTEYQLRGYPKLVGLMLDDPLFSLRHATAQARLCMELLQMQNALIPHQPFGHYAELLYQHAVARGGALNEFVKHLDLPALKKAVLHDERQAVRNQLYGIQERLVQLVNSRSALFNDFLYATDERLLEPYALISAIQQALRSPRACDSHCIEAENRKVIGDALKLTEQLAEGKHALTRNLLPQAPEQRSDTLKRLDALKKKATPKTEAEPERVGLSSLGIFGQTYVAQNLLLGIDELLGDFIRSSALVLKNAEQSTKLTQIRLDRLFVPSFNLLKQLHSQADGLKLITQAEALNQNLVILGVHGGGLSFGLTPTERQTLTRDNYLYANLEAKDGSTVATTSGKEANRLGFSRQNFARRELGHILVIAAPTDDPVVAQFAKIRGIAPHLGKLETLSTTPGLPALATVCAIFSLYANTVGAQELYRNEKTRFIGGLVSATADLAIASNTVALRMLETFGKTGTSWYTFWESKGLYIQSERWASILRQRTGSSLLNYSRIGNVGGMALTAVLFSWDGYRAYRDGEDDQALAYGGLAFAGAASWALYGLGLLGGPLTIAVGLGLFVGGLAAATLLADSPAEQAVKHGPFGNKQRHPQMNDPRLAYQQLLGTLGQPQIRIARVSDWFAKAPKEERLEVKKAAARHKVNLDALDWVVELESALLSQYPNGQRFILHAWERRADLTYGRGWDYRKPPRNIPKEKLGPLVMDATRVLFVLGRQHPTEWIPGYSFRYALRVCAQFHLSELQCRADDLFPEYKNLILPQPAPRSWKPYDPRLAPRSNDTEEVVPYWCIKQSDFRPL